MWLSARVWRLAVAVAGVIESRFDSHRGSWPSGWPLALAAAALTLIGFLWTRHDLPEPRPGYWSMRFMLIHDTFHSQS